MKPMNRNAALKRVGRGGLFAGVVALGAVLSTREEKFQCANHCGRCSKLVDGKCGLNLK